MHANVCFGERAVYARTGVSQKKKPILGKRIGAFSLYCCPGAILAVFPSLRRGAHARQLLLNAVLDRS